MLLRYLKTQIELVLFSSTEEIDSEDLIEDLLSWEACSFLKETEEELILGKWEAWEREREGV